MQRSCARRFVCRGFVCETARVAIGVPSLSVVQIEFHQAHVALEFGTRTISRNEGASECVVHLSKNKARNVSKLEQVDIISIKST